MRVDKNSLATLLRTRRAELGITQRQAAERCSVSASTYAAIERAERDVRDVTLHLLGSGLGLGGRVADTYYADDEHDGMVGVVESVERRGDAELTVRLTTSRTWRIVPGDEVVLLHSA